MVIQRRINMLQGQNISVFFFFFFFFGGGGGVRISYILLIAPWPENIHRGWYRTCDS